jgi:fluoroacetyl-CoA thioesterase
MRAVEIGATAMQEHRVRPADCAVRWGNDLPVLATPVLLWLAETTAMRVVEEALEDGEITVGAGHTARHLAATPVGWTVRIQARLTRIEGKQLHFDVSADDGVHTILAGEHVRAAVGRARFLERLDRKARSAA